MHTEHCVVLKTIFIPTSAYTPPNRLLKSPVSVLIAILNTFGIQNVHLGAQVLQTDLELKDEVNLS